MIKEILSTFLDGMGLPVLIAGCAWALIGLAISLLMEGLTRDPLKEGTPIQWDWKTFFSGKFKRFLMQATLDVLVIIATIKFMDDILGKFSMFYCFLIGFGLDYVISNWKEIRAKLPAIFKKHS